MKRRTSFSILLGIVTAPFSCLKNKEVTLPLDEDVIAKARKMGHTFTPDESIAKDLNQEGVSLSDFRVHEFSECSPFHHGCPTFNKDDNGQVIDYNTKPFICKRSDLQDKEFEKRMKRMVKCIKKGKA